MLFIPLLILVTVISGSYYIFGTIPTFFSWLSLILGVLTLLSRIIAWTSGIAQQTISMLSEIGSSAVTRNLIMESVLWLLAGLNIYLFLVST